MRTESIGLIIALSLCLAGCGQGPKDQREKRALRVHLAKRGNQDRRGQLVLKARPVLPVLRDRQVRPPQIRFALSVSIAVRVHVQQHVTRMKCS